jgi:hypothetical protein
MWAGGSTGERWFSLAHSLIPSRGQYVHRVFGTVSQNSTQFYTCFVKHLNFNSSDSKLFIPFFPSCTPSHLPLSSHGTPHRHRLTSASPHAAITVPAAWAPSAPIANLSFHLVSRRPAAYDMIIGVTHTTTIGHYSNGP